MNKCHRHKLLYVSKHIGRDRYMPNLYLKHELHIDYFNKSKHQATGEALAGWREVGQQDSRMTAITGTLAGDRGSTHGVLPTNIVIYGVYSIGLYILFDLKCISNFLALVKKDKTVFQCI